MRLLFVENHATFADVVIDQFLADHDVVLRATVAGTRALIRDDLAFDAVLVDYDLDDGKGVEVIDALRAAGYQGLTVVVSAHHEGNESLMRAGAHVVCAKAEFAGIDRVLAAGRTVDRVRGALLGTLIGDALGRPFEGTPTSDIARLEERLRRRAAAPRAWGHSDDGEMMLNLAASLCRGRELEEEDLLATLAENHEPARGYGKGARAAFRAWRAGHSPEDAARALWEEGSRGNGGAVRVAPVAAWALDESEAVVADLASRTASVTHAHAEARCGAAVIAVAVHRALRGVDQSGVVAGLHALAAHLLAERLRAVDALRNASPKEVAARLGNGVLAIESVPAALWAFDGSKSFEDAVIRAVGLAGDTDSIGAMAGAVAGAFFGASGIASSWTAALEAPAVDAADRYAVLLGRARRTAG